MTTRAPARPTRPASQRSTAPASARGGTRAPRPPREHSPARPRRVDPRIQARRVGIQREVGRRRLRRLLVALGLLALVTGAVGLALSPLFAVDGVQVTGAGNRSAEVRAAARVEIGAPLLLLGRGDVAERVERLPWVRSARVERELPNTVRIVVTPRVGVAWAPPTIPGAAVALLDGRGVVIGTSPAPPPGLPELVGIAHVPAPGARTRATAAAEVAAALGPLAGRTASVSVAAGVATVHLTSGPEVRFGALDRLGEKARAAASVLSETDLSAAHYLDVRVPSAPATG